jgi:lysophospholipase L1-like esterase
MKGMGLVIAVTGVALLGCAGAAVPAASQPAPTDAAAPSLAATEPPPMVPATDAPSPRRIAYVPLGDSYAIGTSVRPRERWPNQLVRALRPEIELEITRNLAVDGATADDVRDRQVPRLDDLDPDFVTLQVGVNDVVRRASVEAFEEDVEALLDDVAERVPADRILIVSIPDYTLTPHGYRYGDPDRQAARVDRFNEVLAEAAEQRGLAFVDVGPIADRVGDDDELLADDGLHPSSKQYAGWIELVAPVARELLLFP